MPKKTQMSRFPIHDELTAPEGSLPVLKSALASAGQLPNFLGVLAGSPAALRGYTRFRGELRHGALQLPTLERIALAVAEHYRSAPGIAIHRRTARQAGLGIDEVAPGARVGVARPARGRAAALPQAARDPARQPSPAPPRGGARRPAGPTSSCSKPSRCSAWNASRRWSNVAGEIPVDGSVEETRVLAGRLSR